MARIAGVDLPREKRIEVGLTYVYGIGQSTADEILAGTGINPDTRSRICLLTMKLRSVTTLTKTISSLRAISAGTSRWTLSV